MKSWVITCVALIAIAVSGLRDQMSPDNAVIACCILIGAYIIGHAIENTSQK